MAQLETTRGLRADVARLPPSRAEQTAAGGRLSRWEGLLPWQVRRVLDYIENGLNGRPSIKIAAEHARLSPSYFSRRFRQSFGVTFAQFVARRRIARAQAMMVRSSSSLCQIALACGFTDQAHFTRTFGGLTGATPSRWRRSAIRPIGQAEAMGCC